MMFAWSTAFVGSGIAAEYPEGATHDSDCAIGVSAGAAPVYLVEPVVQAVREWAIHLAAGEESHVGGDGGQTEDARSALTGALIGQVAGDPRRFGNPAGRRTQDDDDADPRCGTDGP
jgi:hypothetical protein